MKILLYMALIAASATAAAARPPASSALGSAPPPFIRAPLPDTDADLDRAEHESQTSRSFADTFANSLGIRNGQAELFDGEDLGIGSREHLSGSIDAKGAAIRLRW